jgi:hypothetical protein
MSYIGFMKTKIPRLATLVASGVIFLVLLFVFLLNRRQIRPRQDPSPRPATERNSRPSAFQAYVIQLSWNGHWAWINPGYSFDFIFIPRACKEHQSELLLENIRVLTVNDQTGHSGKFTLQVTATQAEMLTAARKQGKVIPILHCSNEGSRVRNAHP